MVVKAVESADGFIDCCRLHVKYSRKALARIMRIHKECMYPSQVKDVKLLTSAFFSSGRTHGMSWSSWSYAE